MEQHQPTPLWISLSEHNRSHLRKQAGMTTQAVNRAEVFHSSRLPFLSQCGISLPSFARRVIFFEALRQSTFSELLRHVVSCEVLREFFSLWQFQPGLFRSAMVAM